MYFFGVVTPCILVEFYRLIWTSVNFYQIIWCNIPGTVIFINVAVRTWNPTKSNSKGGGTTASQRSQNGRPNFDFRQAKHNFHHVHIGSGTRSSIQRVPETDSHLCKDVQNTWNVICMPLYNLHAAFYKTDSRYELSIVTCRVYDLIFFIIIESDQSCKPCCFKTRGSITDWPRRLLYKHWNITRTYLIASSCLTLSPWRLLTVGLQITAPARAGTSGGGWTVSPASEGRSRKPDVVRLLLIESSATPRSMPLYQWKWFTRTPIDGSCRKLQTYKDMLD